MARRFELSEGTSNKFWQIELSGSSITVSFGKIGSAGQTQTKSFDTDVKAEAEHDKLIKEKIKKGYAEVGEVGGAAPVAPKPKAPAPATSAPAPVATLAAAPTPASAPVAAAPPASAPTSTLAITSGVLWTDAAKREVAPRRGWDVVAVKKPDAKDAYAKIRPAFELAKAALDLGRARPGADTARVDAARAAFAGAGPEAKLDLEAQAAACALVGLRLSFNDRYRQHVFVRYWWAVEGAAFAMRALARSSELTTLTHVGSGSTLVELTIAADPSTKVEGPWFRGQDDTTWRTLRAAVLAEGEGARVALEGVAAELRARAELPMRALLACALEKADWAREDLAEAFRATVHHSLASWAWPLILSLPREEADKALDAIATDPWARVHAIEPIRFDLLAAFGPAIVPQFFAAMKEGAAAGVDKMRSLGEAISLVVSPEVVDFFIAQLSTKDLRALASEYLSSHPHAAAPALAIASAGKGPAADAARAVLRHVVAVHPDAAKAAKATLSGAPLAAIEALENTAAREDAPLDALPSVLRDVPWKQKTRKAPPKVVKNLTPLSSDEGVEWRGGEAEAAAMRTGWLAPRPEKRAQTLAAIREANATTPAGKSPWQLPSGTLFAQLPDEDAVAAFNEAKLEHYSWSYLAPIGELMVARHGLAVFPGLENLAWSDLPGVIAALRRVRSPRVARYMAEAYVRLKKSRDLAATWLLAFHDAAIIGLVPIAVGEPSSGRSYAEAALRFLGSRGHRAAIEDVANKHGPEALEAVIAVLDFDPNLLLPKKIPTLPTFFQAGAFSRPLLAGRTHALPIASVEAIGTMLAFTSWDDPYPGLVEIKAACDARSLADFAWDLFQAWLVSGASSKESWAMLALGWFGDDECARKLTPLIRAWPGEAAHARAVTALDVLAKIGSDVALMHLHGIAQKVKFKGLQEKAREKIDQIAEARGLSAEELADRLVPDLGLDDDGTRWLDFGPRKVKVVFDESLKPAVVDESGKRLPDLPKAKQSDDPEKASAATAAWKALKKDAKAIAQGQILRLELAMCAQRRWSPEVFRAFLLEHPLLIHLVRRLVWGTYAADGKMLGSFRVAEDSSLANAEDALYEIPDGAQVGIVHRWEIGDALAGMWGQVFADYEILQPFEQISRVVASPTDAEKVAKTLDRVKDLTVSTGKVLGLDARGWRRGFPQDGGVVSWYEKPVQGGLVLMLDLDPGIFTGMISESREQTLGSVTVDTEGGGNGWGRKDAGIAMGDLPPIVFSELVRDLETLRS